MLTPEDFANEYDAYDDIAQRWEVRLLPVTDWDGETFASRRQPIPVNSPSRAALAAVFANYFHRETEFDFPPYSRGDEEDPDRSVYLIPSERVNLLFPVATGAVGVLKSGDISMVTWAWIHPFERVESPDLWMRTWTWLEAKFPGLGVEAPLSPPMNAFARRLDLYGQHRVHGRR